MQRTFIFSNYLVKVLNEKDEIANASVRIPYDSTLSDTQIEKRIKKALPKELSLIKIVGVTREEELRYMSDEFFYENSEIMTKPTKKDE